MPKNKIKIHWFKRDLRLQDNLSIFNMIKHDPSTPLIFIYIDENDYWNLPDASRLHRKFIRDCLQSIDESLKKHSQKLLLFKADSAICVFKDLSKLYEITVFSYEETGNDWTFSRDRALKSFFENQNILWVEMPTNGVVRRLQNRDDWVKIRDQRMQGEPILQYNIPPLEISHNDLGAIGSLVDLSEMTNTSREFIDAQKGGAPQAQFILESFLEKRFQGFHHHISSPVMAIRGGSRLSPYLTFGCLSMRQVWHALNEKMDQVEHTYHKKSLAAFRSRLYWRCHFVQKLESRPGIEFNCIHSQFEALRDQNNTKFLDSYLRGETGFPLIDACMKHLQRYGWINFRMRAMIASFAAYNLWLDWRQYKDGLARIFIDYEPGIHYSQLQMQAGVTGMNALRIYNPVKQSKDQDPDAVFIKSQLPELRNVPNDWLHEPWKMASGLPKYGVHLGENYPRPCVDHEVSARFAKNEFKKIQKGDSYYDEKQQNMKNLASRKKKSRPKTSVKQKTFNQLTLFD